MSFSVSWTKSDGKRAEIECETANDAVGEIVEVGGHTTPGLRIKDAGGVSLTFEQLIILAAQAATKEDEPSDKN